MRQACERDGEGKRHLGGQTDGDEEKGHPILSQDDGERANDSEQPLSTSVDSFSCALSGSLI